MHPQRAHNPQTPSQRQNKRHYGYLLSRLHELGWAPTLYIANHLWRALFMKISEEFVEHGAAKYLEDWYTDTPPVAHPFCSRCAVPGQDGAMVSCSAKTGLQGARPGTASGNHAVESFHGKWATSIAKQGRDSLTSIFSRMQNLYRGEFKRWLSPKLDSLAPWWQPQAWTSIPTSCARWAATLPVAGGQPQSFPP